MVMSHSSRGSSRRSLFAAIVPAVPDPRITSVRITGPSVGFPPSSRASILPRVLLGGAPQLGPTSVRERRDHWHGYLPRGTREGCLLYTSDAADEIERCRSRWSPY